MPVKRDLIMLGWREMVALPDLGIEGAQAKIDTGARTSALHAHVLETFRKGEREYVRFAIDYAPQKVQQVCEEIRVDRRSITSSNGEAEERLIVKTQIRIGDTAFRAEFSLADRSDMVFPILIGRTALRSRFVVNPARSYLQSPARARKRILG